MQWDLDEEKLAWTNTGCSQWKWIIENYMLVKMNECLLYIYDFYLLNINSYQFISSLQYNVSNQWNIVWWFQEVLYASNSVFAFPM